LPFQQQLQPLPTFQALFYIQTLVFTAQPVFLSPQTCVFAQGASILLFS
jgi:hypothetical protein